MKTIFFIISSVTISLCMIVSPAYAFIGFDITFADTFGRPRSKAVGEMNYPSGISVDSVTGYTYVSDAYNHRIQVFDDAGNYVNHWLCVGPLGSGIDSVNEFIYVAIPGKNEVRKFDLQGNLLTTLYGGSPGPFNQPRDVAVNQLTGDLFVLDSENKRVQVFDKDGNFLRHWDGAFYKPYGIAVDSVHQLLYVASTGGANIQKFDLDGNLLLKWGSLGSAPGQFRWPRGVSIGSTGDIFVADTDMERVQQFDSDGNFIQVIQGPHNYEEGPFHPRSIAINTSNDDIFVTASYAHRVDRFNAMGDYILSWGHLDRDGDFFNAPKGISANRITGNIFIADSSNFLIKEFSQYGAFIDQYCGRTAVDRSTNYLSFPSAISIDSLGNIWGIHQGIHYPDDLTWGSDTYIRKFDATGNFLYGIAHPDFSQGMKGIALTKDDRLIFITNSPKNKIMVFDGFGNLAYEFGSLGSLPGQFIKPAGIAIDPLNNFLYVVDTGNNRIQKFDLLGNHLLSWGTYGSAQGQFSFNDNSLLAVDENGYIYVADSSNARIQIFDSEGNFLYSVGQYGWGAELFKWPAAVTVAHQKIYVLDTGGSQVEIFNLDKIYENGEDGNTGRWQIYDNLPTGAQIINVYDSEQQNNVMQFLGTGTDNGYVLRNSQGNKWHNSHQFVIEWKMKFAGEFKVYLDVETTAGHRYLSYNQEDADRLGTGEYVHHGLGNIMDSQWHTVTRDLQADYQKAQPGEELIEVNGFLVRGDGYVDDIVLRNSFPPSYDTDRDGITDLDELYFYGTKATLPDSDYDQIPDGDELMFWGPDNWFLDIDNDALVNLIDIDSDNDTFSDGEEIAAGTDPADPSNFPARLPTLYEDAEDGSIDRWQIYDDTPFGAQILNGYDEDRMSNVIQFLGAGTGNGYVLRNSQENKWHNTDQFVIEWKMKFAERFRIYIDVNTTAGHRYLSYTGEGTDILGTGEYVHHGLGDIMDSNWHTITRDLQVDFQEAQPGETILEVNGFLIRGSGSVDEILLK